MATERPTGRQSIQSMCIGQRDDWLAHKVEGIEQDAGGFAQGIMFNI